MSILPRVQHLLAVARLEAAMAAATAHLLEHQQRLTHPRAGLVEEVVRHLLYGRRRRPIAKGEDFPLIDLKRVGAFELAGGRRQLAAGRVLRRRHALELECPVESLADVAVTRECSAGSLGQLRL